jgi:hypothetical protein
MRQMVDCLRPEGELKAVRDNGVSAPLLQPGTADCTAFPIGRSSHVLIGTCYEPQTLWYLLVSYPVAAPRRSRNSRGRLYIDPLIAG